MAKCNCCSAPLPADTNRCLYCNVRNDVDLQNRHQYTITNKQSERICPHCNKALETINLDLAETLTIERCKTCYGLFFDPGEIEALLENSVSHVFNINFNLIKNINKDRYQKNKNVKYVKCPVCQEFMNRVNFGHRSGVIIDQCYKHGIWLDSGEITHLMEWKKAGGEILHAKNKERLEAKKKIIKPNTSYQHSLSSQQPKSLETELVKSVSSLVFKLFS